MKNLSLFIGLRYFRAKKNNKFISFVTGISIIGTTIGVMAIIVVLSVMNGFQNTVRDKIINTGFHIYLTSYGKTSLVYDYPQVVKDILKIKNKNIQVAAPFFKGQVIIKSSLQRIMGIDFHGVEKDLFVKDQSFLRTVAIVEGKNDLSNNENILIGQELADYLDVKVNDYVDIISPQGGNIKYMGRIAPIMRRYRIAGVFKTGYYEYDLKLAFTSLASMQSLFNKQAAWGIGIKINDIYQAPVIAKIIKKLFHYNYQVFTWMDLNHNLFTALKTEKTMMSLIVFLVIIVAAINIASTLIMMIAEKKKEIAILRSFGASAWQITNIFIFTGFFIGCMGILAGLSLGLLVSFNLDKIFQFIEGIVNLISTVWVWIINLFTYMPFPEKFQLLPKDVYYLDHLPVEVLLSDVLSVCLGTIFFILIFSFFPARQATKFRPMEIIRYE